MRYLYYKLWQLFKKIKTNDMPATNAMIFLSICVFANIFVIHFLLSKAFHFEIGFNSRGDVYAFTIPIGISVYFLGYLFLYKKRDKIYEKYRDESRKQKILGSLLLVLYILGSFILTFYLLSNYSDGVTK